ncbi:hypothetical protein D1793_18290 [Halomonas sp. JS92-SW72]|nr:hypothetical protein D1793_18290 [Halomonas sp. JS92-SW72]
MTLPPHAPIHDPIRRTKIVATLGPASDREGVLWQAKRPELFTKRVINHTGPDTYSRRVGQDIEWGRLEAGP